MPLKPSARALCFVFALVALTIGSAFAQTIPNTVTIRNFFKAGNDSLTFNRPLLVKPYPGEDSAFIVLEQRGQLLTVRWNGTAWRKTDSAMVSVLNGTNGIDEQGLLGFTFHPNYSQNRKYYVYFVSGSNSARFDVLAERIAGSSGRPATADVQRTLLRVSDPYDNHNAGTIGFDGEGFLVLGIGDGGPGSGGDPENRAQNRMSFLGKFLRFDVDGADAFPTDTTRNFAIPATNPFVDSANVLPEIWAYGARNPWKWTFHPITGEIWAGDVGQDLFEEITRVPKGANLGWSIEEGFTCFNKANKTNPLSSCDTAGITPPAMALQRSHATCITGGTFFIDSATSAFNGTYIFGDYGTTQNLWAARVQNGKLVDSTRIGELNKVVSFDRDHQGRILATTISPTVGFGISSNVGQVFVLESPDMSSSPVPLRATRATNRPALKPLLLTTILAHRERYTLTRLDGSVIQGVPDGVFLVQERGGKVPARVMTAIGN